MRLLGADLGGGGEIFCLLVTLVSLARAQLDILAQKVIKILSSRKESLKKRTELVIRNIFNEDIPP